MFIFLVFIVPIVWLAVAKMYFKCKLTISEMIIQFGIAGLMAGILFWIGHLGQTTDHHVVTGVVHDKQQVRVSCSHAYQCMCVTHSDGNGGTYQTCQTCYDHTHDYDWRVLSTVGAINIQRVDRQGVRTPDRWRQVRIGEPFHTTQRFTNYVQASPNSVFQRGDREYDGELPDYPSVYDYYRINRVVGSASGVNTRQLNTLVSESLARMNVKDELNVVVVLTEEDRTFFTALEYHWLSGKDNDIIMVFGLKDGVVDWQENMTYGAGMGNRLVINELQSMAQGADFSEQLVLSMIDKAMGGFQRVGSEEFEYLKDTIKPSFWFTIIAMLVNLAAAVILTRVFSQGQFHFIQPRNKRYYR